MSSTSFSPFVLTGKRLLVTGASSGIGRTCAVELSKLGAEIILVARGRAQLNDTLNMMSGNGHRVIPFDLSCGERVVPWMKELCIETGVIDGLLHCAGISITMPIRATTTEAFAKVININLESSYFLAKAFRQKQVRASEGSIVFIGSVMSLVGQPGLTVYSASKGALVPLAKSLALEFAKERIRVNVVAPGHIETPMAKNTESTLPAEAIKAIQSKHPLGIGRPEDIAYACAYLLSDASRWVTGTTLTVDGGYTAA